MKGPRITEVLFSVARANPDFRVDAEFHKEMPPDNARYEYVPIGDVLESSQYGLSIEMNEDNNGYPIYRMNEISGMLCAADVLKCADVSRQEAEAFVLNEGDVLFNRTNSQTFVGRTGVFKPFNGDPYIFASYLVRLIPKSDLVLPEYLATFLNSQLGVTDVKRRARISINQSNVNPEEVKAVRIPLLSMHLQKEIARHFGDAHVAIKTSRETYAQAETLLLRELGLEGWQPPEPLAYQSTFSQAWGDGRLDAEHFQPRFEAAEVALRKSGAIDFVELDTLLDSIGNGHTPLHHDLSVGEVPFLCAEHVNDFQVRFDSNKRVLQSQYELELASSQLRENDVLVTIKGRVGNVAIIENLPGPATINQDVALLRFNKALPVWYTITFLNSRFGKLAVARNTTGQINPFLALGNLKRVRVPMFESSFMEQIAEKAKALIQEAERKKTNSKLLLEAAKRAVEVAIEDSEDAALALLAQAAAEPV